MSVSSVGKGLTVAINCEILPHHEWMSFLLYWSCVKHLPEAKVTVACMRQLMNMNIYNWCRRTQVPLLFHKYDDVRDIHHFVRTHRTTQTDCVVVANPCTVFLRDFEEADIDNDIFTRLIHVSGADGFVSDIKSENPTVCCDYSNGWGKFVTSNWINKKSIPFSSVNFADAGMTVNENRLARIWKSATKIYPSLTRG